MYTVRKVEIVLSIQKNLKKEEKNRNSRGRWIIRSAANLPRDLSHEFSEGNPFFLANEFARNPGNVLLYREIGRNHRKVWAIQRYLAQWPSYSNDSEVFKLFHRRLRFPLGAPIFLYVSRIWKSIAPCSIRANIGAYLGTYLHVRLGTPAILK